MKISFLGQGYYKDSPKAVGNYLNKYLLQDSFSSFFGISAFASPLGIRLINSFEQAKKNFREINIVVGIDQNGTSREALEEIQRLEVNSFIFYQKESPIFHPKIYLFEGKNQTALIVGSSNITGKGLFTNVEVSLLIEFKNDDDEGIRLINELKDYFKSIFDFSDPNLFRIESEIIEGFVADGIVPSEIKRSKQHGKKPSSGEKERAPSIIVLKRTVSTIPWAKIKKVKAETDEFESQEELEISSEYNINDLLNRKPEILWESGPLTERDLNIPKGSTTNPTGSMLFKKGKLKGIDQRHYFRDNVFSSLTWIRDTRPDKSHLERATAMFQLIIKGKDYGIFSLMLTHNTRTDTKSYEQKNSMTSISWGEAKEKIAKDELIGATLTLLDSKVSDDLFILKIE